MKYSREDVRQMEFGCSLEQVSQEPLVLTIDRFVEQLDLEVLESRYSSAGTGYYDPKMMLKVWFFAYCDRSWHCREVAQRIRYDIRYRYFVGSHRPDFRTLNRFRKDHLDLLAGYFAALVSHCEQLGLIDSSVVALDGTKLRANASGRKRSQESLRQEIGKRLQEDAAAEEDGGKLEKGDDSDSSARPPVSRTDPEARLMKTGEGTVRLCYNAQVVVDNHQIIVAADVGTDADDKSSLPPLLEQADRQLSSQLGAIVADGGYYSGRNVKYAQEQGLDVYIPKGRDNHKVLGLESFVYDALNDRYQCPNSQWLLRGLDRRHRGMSKATYRSTTKQCRDCPLKAACTKGRYRSLEVAETILPERELATKLASAEGQLIYARRRELVEPVFGNLKFNFGFTRFSLRGLSQVKGEFLLLCIAHNLKKLAQWQGHRRTRALFVTVFKRIWSFLNHYQSYLATIGTIKRRSCCFALSS